MPPALLVYHAVRILAVNGHDVVLRGLQALFAGTDIRLAATANCAAEAVIEVKRQEMDIVLTEVRLDGCYGCDGLAVLEGGKLRSPKCL